MWTGKHLRPLIEFGFPLIENVFTLLAESVLIPLVLIAAVSAVDAGIHKKILRSRTATLGCSGLLIKFVTQTIGNETKEQRCGLLAMLLGAIDVNVLGNILPVD